MTTDDKEAAIIRKIKDYAHAENIMIQLRQLEKRMTTAEAIDVIYHEVCE